MNTIKNRVLHRLAVAVAVASLMITTSIALFGSTPASADPSVQARRAASTALTRKPAKKKRNWPPKAKPVTGVVNINTANRAELIKLPGIGPAKAERILTFRKRRGNFRRVRDLRRVKGIGRMTLKRLARHLTVKGPTTIR
jgi:competence protein ComEA